MLESLYVTLSILTTSSLAVSHYWSLFCEAILRGRRCRRLSLYHCSRILLKGTMPDLTHNFDIILRYIYASNYSMSDLLRGRYHVICQWRVELGGAVVVESVIDVLVPWLCIIEVLLIRVLIVDEVCCYEITHRRGRWFVIEGLSFIYRRSKNNVLYKERKIVI